MNQEAALKFGEYVKGLRTTQKLTIRGLASKAGLDSGALTRLEHGKVRTPQPDTLKALATALDVPLTDLFAMAGYAVHDLPSINPYLRARYSELSDDAITSIDNYLKRIIDEPGFEPYGPADLEDELDEPSPR